MELPKATTVTEKYLDAIYKELKKMNSEKEPVELQGYERWTCDICGKTFSKESSLKSHKTRVHK